MDISHILTKQRRFFASGTTLPISFRLEQLNKLKSLIQGHETEIFAALQKDLHRPPAESYVTEITLVLSEIDYICKHLRTWIKPRKTTSPFPQCWPGKSRIYYQPYGSVCIIGPWNYPFLLIMSPLIGAICAGNCAVIKPSELAPHTEALLLKLINQHFPTEFITAVSAAAEATARMLEHRFDYIFFTGGTKIGKRVMQAAAEHLTPVTLELGGKSPCIVDDTANLDYAARRIAWSKFINAGQTCIAPDYVLVHSAKKIALCRKIEDVLITFYGTDASLSPHYCRVINTQHHQRLCELLQKGNIITGGKTNTQDCYIAPTLMDGITWDDPVMQEEIFGPILPILTFEDFDEAVASIKTRPKPLALYLFTEKKHRTQQVIEQLAFGAGCINDCLLQIANLHLPFGGIGTSGMGAYHGQFSFETFSHRKGVFEKSLNIDVGVEYPPYSKSKFWWLRKLLG